MAIPTRTLIVNYAGLQPGGIERYLSNLMKYSLKKDYRVIWLTTPECDKNSFYKDVSDSPKIEKVYVRCGWHWNLKIDISFSPEERIIMVSCDPLSYMKAEVVKKEVDVKEFNHFLILPHFTGNVYYPERFFKLNIFRKAVFNFFKKSIINWNDNNCILAFSLKHLDSYEKNYDIIINEKKDKVLKKNNENLPFDIKNVKHKCAERHKKFVIVSCSRFDFPHKGYLLGLVDAFSYLKANNSQLQLVIIGYGSGEQQLCEKIKGLSQDTQNDIILTGALSMEKINDIFSSSHLNIGLAGAILDGASCGTPSLLVRHYSDKCETYGYIHEIDGYLLRDDPGNDIIPYIQEVIDMNEEEYILYCKKDYDSANLRREYDPDYLFNRKDIGTPQNITFRRSFWGAIINFMCFIKMRFFKISGYNE